jgi:hypothetical protein
MVLPVWSSASANWRTYKKLTTKLWLTVRVVLQEITQKEACNLYYQIQIHWIQRLNKKKNTPTRLKL